MADFQCWLHTVSHPSDILQCYLATLPSRGQTIPLLGSGHLVTLLATNSIVEAMLCFTGDAASPLFTEHSHLDRRGALQGV